MNLEHLELPITCKGFPPGELWQLLALMQELDHRGLSILLDPMRQR